jgi:nitroreductase
MSAPSLAPVLAPDTLLGTLAGRYATKAFDPGRGIPAAEWAALERSLVLTPSSYGLQPWRFLVVTDAALRESLVPHCWGQRQVADCSHLLVIAARTGLDEGDLDRWIACAAAARGTGADSLAPYRKMMLGDLVHGPRAATVAEWAKNQAYIALGQFMLAAALLGIDTCPMEGFLPEPVGTALDLPARGYQAAVLCPAGYRAASDKYAAQPKARFPLEEMIERI